MIVATFAAVGKIAGRVQIFDKDITPVAAINAAKVCATGVALPAPPSSPDRVISPNSPTR